MKGRVVAFLSAVLLSTSSAVAQPPSDRPQFALGIAAISSPEPYEGADADILVVPAVSFSYKRFYFRGIVAGYRLWESGELSADLIARARARFGGYDEDDSPALEGMESRRKSADGGIELQWERERLLGVRLTPTTDLLDRSGGQQVTLDVYSPWRFGPVRVEPGVGVEWQSEDLVNYYYGVRPEEARPGRPAFEPGSAVNLTAGVFVFTPVSRRLLLQTFLRYERLDSDIEESPIVDEGGALTAFAALSYAF
ncbi:MAG TPA: MipA/OmpV family protein [Thermoanaerobaculia bacterium]|nr:MipA/OmpV family protein [Thermoanaerobaculia bacterium]